MADSMAASVDGPAPELEVARDLARRGLLVAPVLVLASGVIWGVAGALSSLYAVGLVVVNFLLAAALMAWAARISMTALVVTVMAGYVARLGLITVAVLLVRDQSWVELVPLCLTIVVTHLGLLTWETRHVSMSLAYPGLGPATGAPATNEGRTAP